MRNFFHNISDIVLAILIVAIASGIIFWRMQVIMEYPEKIAAEQAAKQAVIEQQQKEAEEAAKKAEEEAAKKAAEEEAETSEEPQG